MKNILIAGNESYMYLVGDLTKICNIYTMNNLKDTLLSLNAHEFSLIITDYQMPTMIGLRLIEAMKKNGKIKTIPVIGIAHSLYWKDRFVFNGAKYCYAFLESPDILMRQIKTLLDRG